MTHMIKIKEILFNLPMQKILTFAIVLVLFPVVQTRAAGVTPYGDYCKECAIYGTCREVIPLREALIALERYYVEKGYRLGAVYHKGRFIEAEIYKYGRRVDKVLFDRKTGRLRSIY